MSEDSPILRVAIASSGLGHVARGMEAWAESLAAALAGRGIDVTLFRGAGPKKHDYDVVVPCLKRGGAVAQLGRPLNHLGGWRVGLGSPAQIESFSYGLGLLRHLRRNYDVVHVQQGSLAIFLNRAERLNLLSIPLILGNGQAANPEFLGQFQNVQYLSFFDQSRIQESLGNHCRSFVIPNFVDTDTFSAGDKMAARAQFDLPRDAFIVLTVGAHILHKRMDYFISEMARADAIRSGVFHFVIAGASDTETKELTEYGRSMLGDSLSLYTDFPAARMPDLYKAADLFVLCSPTEMLSIALLEAIASSLPVICHSHPVMEWVVGAGGRALDLWQDGPLAEAVVKFSHNPRMCDELGAVGRQRALETFSKSVVTSQVIDMYKEVVSSARRRR